ESCAVKRRRLRRAQARLFARRPVSERWTSRPAWLESPWDRIAEGLLAVTVDSGQRIPQVRYRVGSKTLNLVRLASHKRSKEFSSDRRKSDEKLPALRKY